MTQGVLGVPRLATFRDLKKKKGIKPKYEKKLTKKIKIIPFLR